METKELYKIAIDTRNFEIGLFWKRSNYFLALNTAIAVGFFTQQNSNYECLIAIFGIFTSILWFCVNLGSKFWQSRWEQRAAILEEKLYLSDPVYLFDTNRTIVKNDVVESIKRSEHQYWVIRFIDELVLKKLSVSLMMILLSILFILVWFILLVLSAGWIVEFIHDNMILFAKSFIIIIMK